MKQFYKEEWKRFKAKFLKIFIFVFIIFFSAALLSHVFLVSHPDQAQKRFADLSKKILKKIPVDETSFKQCLFIFFNNLRVSLFSILFGLIPFLFLPILGALANGFSIGLISSICHLKGFKVVPHLLYAVAPHGIFEVPVMLYAVSLGIFLTLQISKRILLGFDDSEEPFFLLLKRIFKTWVGFIIPLLLVAAIVETFVTPFLAKIFLEQ